MKKKKGILIVSGAGIIGLLSIISVKAFISTPNDSHTDELSEFTVGSPILEDVLFYNDYIAQLEAVQHIELKAKVSGFVEKNHVDEGEFVEKGQLLFSVFNKEYKAEHTMAEAQLKSVNAEARVAEIEMENISRLVQKNIVGQAELDVAQANLDALKAKVEEAKSHKIRTAQQLTFTKITAPFSGIINRIPNKTGSLVEEGTTLTTISNNSRVFAYFNISEKEYLNMLSNADDLQDNELIFVMANGENYPHSGKIEVISGEANKNTGNILFRTSFINPDAHLKHGFSGKVKLKNEIKNALVIPQTATMESQDKLYVYTLNDDHKLEKKDIEVSLRLPQMYVIKSGVSVNDRILLEGHQLVNEGEKIIPRFSNPTSNKNQLAFK